MLLADLQDGWTAITFASKNGHSEIVQMLLSGGADVNHQTKVDIPPHQSLDHSLCGSRQKVECLLSGLLCVLDTGVVNCNFRPNLEGKQVVASQLL